MQAPPTASLLSQSFSSPSGPIETTRYSKAADSAIDAYATRLLERKSPPEAIVDSSLGEYVTSLLRCADLKDANHLQQLDEYDSLLELLEDQCRLEASAATEVLQAIAAAVINRAIPPPSTATSMGLYAGAGLDSFQSMKTSFPPVEFTSSTTGGLNGSESSNATGATTIAPSPLQADTLIPVDLMGVLDDPSPHQARQIRQGRLPQHVFQFGSPPPRSHPIALHTPQQPKQHQRISQPPPSTMKDDFPPLGAKSDEAFPPLGATPSTVDRPKKSKVSSSKKQAGSNKSQQHSDKELAAALFRPARPRQNSIEKDDSSSGTGGSSQRPRGSSLGQFSDSATSNNIYFQHQIHSCVEILLSMVQDLGEEAATEAAYLSNGDFNAAHFIVDAALTAPPVCRHVLHGGCYRSDCQFSHDVDGHSCLFWLRGRCGKGSTCHFLHGFNEKLLENVPKPPESMVMSMRVPLLHATDPIPIYPTIIEGMAPPGFAASYQYPSQKPSSRPPTSMGDGCTAAFTPGQASSWQATSSLADSSASNSSSAAYGGGDVLSFSFANVASKGYEKNQFADTDHPPPSRGNNCNGNVPTVRIPQDLWNPHENRDASVFHIVDPMERYHQVASTVQRPDVIDLHFQSAKTFPTVLTTVLPLKLEQQGMEEVWIVTGTGHHVGTKTHQKGGGALETYVLQWLTNEGYRCIRGKDRNGLGGAILVKR